MIKKKEFIKTKRLIIKPYSLIDEDAITDILMNEEVSKTFMIPLYDSIDKYKELAHKLYLFSQVDDIKHYEYGIYLDETLIGFVNDCGYENDEIEIGYVIHPKYKNNGYATEMLKAVIDDLFNMGFNKVKCSYFKNNEASHRVMLKAGMKDIELEEETEYRGIIYKCGNCEVTKNKK